MNKSHEKKLKLTHVQCCVCDSDNAKPVGIGKDYEYHTSVDVFVAMQCDNCGLVYLNPRPEISEFETIYPSNYHAFDFSEKDFGIIYKIRSRLEANRVLSWCKDLPDNAKILDVGCGDGFHLNLLRKYGNKTWQLEGIDVDERAIRMAEKSGLKVHRGTVESLNLPPNSYDFAFMIQTIEHVAHPEKVLSAVFEILKRDAKLVIVTDNTDSLDFRFFKNAYWGGYHFPRHWNLFNRKSLTKLAEKCGFELAALTTQVSPVNWVYSIHNALVDLNAPHFLINQFTLKSTISLSAFTSLDILLQKLGKGGLLLATLQKP
ncbi:MAG TPA: class I SAM-dependent methyltransferase [Pyrinomonadaceae bacterium]|nr:class I SAM-dependent methyltransferase [Pyrinomonadaceae bacterium]